jgi:hypothetical protein
MAAAQENKRSGWRRYFRNEPVEFSDGVYLRGGAGGTLIGQLYGFYSLYWLWAANFQFPTRPRPAWFVWSPLLALGLAWLLDYGIARYRFGRRGLPLARISEGVLTLTYAYGWWWPRQIKAPLSTLRGITVKPPVVKAMRLTGRTRVVFTFSNGQEKTVKSFFGFDPARDAMVFGFLRRNLPPSVPFTVQAPAPGNPSKPGLDDWLLKLYTPACIQKGDGLYLRHDPALGALIALSLLCLTGAMTGGRWWVTLLWLAAAALLLLGLALALRYSYPPGPRIAQVSADTLTLDPPKALWPRRFRAPLSTIRSVSVQTRKQGSAICIIRCELIDGRTKTSRQLYTPAIKTAVCDFLRRELPASIKLAVDGELQNK